MAHNSDYVPRRDALFNDWFKNITRYAAVKCEGTSPEWTHIPKAALDNLIKAYGDWYTAYSLCLKPHNKAETTAKNEVKKAVVAIIRLFVQQYLMFPPVTDADRDNMGIPNRDKVHSSVERPPLPPEFTLKPVDNRLVRADFRAKGSKSRARPYGYAGAMVHWAVLDHPPASYEELVHHDLASKTPFVMEFSENDRGKRLYVAMYWQNEKGEKGPWSDILSTIVP